MLTLKKRFYIKIVGVPTDIKMGGFVLFTFWPRHEGSNLSINKMTKPDPGPYCVIHQAGSLVK